MDQVPETFNKYLFLKRTLQFVFSISVLSFFLCFSSGFSVHPQSFNACFSTCLFSMFTHTLERKYMFLICNGILAFLARNPLMASSSSPDFQASNMSETKAPPVSDTVVVPLVVEEQVLDQVRVQQEHYEEASESTEEEQGDSTYIQNKDNEGNDEKEEGKEGGTESEAMVTQDDDEVEETTMATNELELANTDELNRKFEEFIRKMKEEIRIEAQRQLIAV